MDQPDDAATLHASCVVLGEGGILIRGASGSGKSTLARQLIERGHAAGFFARLVCDDRVRVARRHGRLVARAVPAIAGRLEIRGLGLVDVPYEPAAVLRLVVDCDLAAPRMPEDAELHAEILGVALPRLAVGDHDDRIGAILWRWRGVCDTLLTVA